MKKLSEAQVAALGAVASYQMQVGYEFLAGPKHKTLASLERLGLVAVQGMRKVYWVLTPEGRAEVERLIDEGALHKEETK